MQENDSKNLGELIDLFNEFKNSYDIEKVKLFEVSKALCDNTKTQNEKIDTLNISYKNLINSIDTKINNIRLSILKINQSIEQSNKNQNINNENINNRLFELENNSEIELIENINKKLDNFAKDYNERLTILESVSGHRDKSNNYLYIVYHWLTDWITRPIRERKERKLKEIEESKRIAEEEKRIKIEKERKAKEEEEKLKKEKENMAKIQNILSRKKR